jgi:hypothetical protein
MRYAAFAFAVMIGASSGAQVAPADAFRSNPKSLRTQELPDGLVGIRINGESSTLLTSLFMGMRSGAPSNAEFDVMMQLMSMMWVDPEEFARALAAPGTLVRAYTFDLSATMLASHRATAPRTHLFHESFMNPNAIAVFSPDREMTRQKLLTLEAKMNAPAEAAVQESTRPDRPDVPIGPEARSRADWIATAKQVAQGLALYETDHNGFPPANSTDAARQMILPYLINGKAWPIAIGNRLLYNTALGRLSSVQIQNPSQRLLVWTEAIVQGGRVVAFVDGSARWVSNRDWELMWKRETELRKQTIIPRTSRG